MARQKLKKFAENSIRDNVIEPGKPIFKTVKGKWRREVFNNDNDIVLEVACGRGEYTIGLASNFPDKNFIGIDIKGDRLWYGSRYAEEHDLHNAAFLRSKVHDLQDLFEEGEVNEIWIIHPDPRPKNKDERRRLTNQRFLDMYKKITARDAWIRLKTDSRSLFDYTLEVLEQNNIKDLSYTFDLDNSDLYNEHYGIETRYERKFKELGYAINYLKFRFDD